MVTKVEGQHDWDGKSRNLTWKLHIIDQSSKTGALEFSVPSADPKVGERGGEGERERRREGEGEGREKDNCRSSTRYDEGKIRERELCLLYFVSLN